MIRQVRRRPALTHGRAECERTSTVTVGGADIIEDGRARCSVRSTIMQANAAPPAVTTALTSQVYGDRGGLGLDAGFGAVSSVARDAYGR